MISVPKHTAKSTRLFIATTLTRAWLRPITPDLHPQEESDLAPSPDLGDLTSAAMCMADRLNLEQRAAYDAIIQSTLNQEEKQFFLDGPG